MKKFIINSIFFASLIITVLLILFSMADGYADPFYMRFTSPKQTSLILGTSRAAQGIQPQVLNTLLSRKDFFNYSFTLGHSRYGPNYLELIKRKLDTQSKQSVFIVTVDPWSISNTDKESDDISKFKEIGDVETSNMYFVNMNPNYYYLLFKYNDSYIHLVRKTNPDIFLHVDGWLEITCRMDSVSVRKRLDEKINNYRTVNLKKYKFSNIRYKYLIKTINYLKNYGTVYLVRLPIHPLMMDIENELMPEFNEYVKKICDSEDVNYFNMTYLNDICSYTDGNHLYKDSGREVTERLAEWVIQQDKQ